MQQPFFHALKHEKILPLTLVVVLSNSLHGITRYLLPDDCLKNFVVPCLHNLSSIDKELTEDPMFVLQIVQAGYFFHLAPLCNKI